jgi:hypothetical protein
MLHGMTGCNLLSPWKLRFSQWCCWRCQVSGVWCCLLWWVVSDVQKACCVITFTVKKKSHAKKKKKGEIVCQHLKWWNSRGRWGCIQAVLSASGTDQSRYMGQGSWSLECIMVIKAKWMKIKCSKLNKWLKRGVQHWRGLLVGANRANKMIKMEWHGFP